MRCIILFLGWIEEHGVLVHSVGVLLGAGLILYQIRKQHRNTIEQKEKEFRDSLNLKIYETIAEKIFNAQSKINTVCVEAFSLGFNLEIYWVLRDQGVDLPMKSRGKELVALNFQAQEATNQLVFISDRHQFALPGFDIFRLVFSRHLNNHVEAFNALFNKVAVFLPTDVPLEQQRTGLSAVIQNNRPSPEVLVEIKILASKYFDECGDLLSILQDLSVETQNRLVGPIFNTKVEWPKKKASMKRIVTSGNDYKEVRAYYESLNQQTDIQ